MRLISLSANKSTFKKVEFTNESGLNFIIATQQETTSSKQGDTTNGVGKSLMIALIHFCMGSSNKEEFKDKLNGWIFTLEFKVKGVSYTAKRSCDNQGRIFLNGKDLSRTKFNTEMESLLFNTPENVKYLTFRSLFPFFIRSNKKAYSEYNNPGNANTAYQIQLVNAYLLGLDIYLSDTKRNLRVEKERIKTLKGQLKKDDLLQGFFVGDRDSSLAKQELEDQIEKMEADLAEFRVAEDYAEINKEADLIKRKLKKISNKITLSKNRIENIELSRKISPDIKKENIEQIYKEASVIIKEEFIKELSELEKFYHHLTTSREKRLSEQKGELLRQLELLKEDQKKFGDELDEKLQYLGAHQALDVFLRLSNKLGDLKAQKDSITKYDDLLKEYDKTSLKIEEDLIEELKKTDLFLEESQSVVKVLNDYFRNLSKRFYPNSPAGIIVSNNKGDNQIRYDIDAKIEADASDGIFSVKTFCYDLTMLIEGYSHNIDFLFHDSRLLDGIDPRQKSELFLVLNEQIDSANKQYILTLNQNQIEEVKEILSDEQFKSIITNNVILNLGDSSPEEKLLGIQVDMKY